MANSLLALVPFAGGYHVTLDTNPEVPAPFIIYSDGSVYVAGVQATNITFNNNVLTVPSMVLGQDTLTLVSLTFTTFPPALPTFQGTATADDQQISFQGNCLVALPAPTLAAAVGATGLFSTGNQVTMQDLFGDNVCLDSQQAVIVRADEDAVTFTVTIENDSLYLSYDQKYLVLGGQNRIYATADSLADATPFGIGALLSGYAVLSLTQNGQTLYWQNLSGYIEPQAHQNLAEAIQFSISVINPQPGLELYPVPELTTACELAWAVFLYQVTGGLFFALGIGPYIATGEVKTGVVGLLMSSQTLREAAQDIVESANADQIAAVVSGTVLFLAGIYQAGLLWQLMKILLTNLGWTAVFRVLAKVIALVLLTEAEAADLLASFTIWCINTVIDGASVHGECHADDVPGTFFPA